MEEIQRNLVQTLHRKATRFTECCVLQRGLFLSRPPWMPARLFQLSVRPSVSASGAKQFANFCCAWLLVFFAGSLPRCGCLSELLPAAFSPSFLEVTLQAELCVTRSGPVLIRIDRPSAHLTTHSSGPAPAARTACAHPPACLSLFSQPSIARYSVYRRESTLTSRFQNGRQVLGGRSRRQQCGRGTGSANGEPCLILPDTAPRSFLY